MHKGKRQACVKKLEDIVQNVRPPGFKGDRRTRHLKVGEASFNLIDDYLDEYESVIEDLLIHLGWAEKWSEAYLDEALRRIIANTIIAGVADGLDQLIETLSSDFQRYSRIHVVRLPLFGIQTDIDSLSLGNIVLEEMTQTKVDDIAALSDEVLDRTTSAPEIVKFAKQKNREALQSLCGKVCARFEAVAEPIRAKQRAEEETRRVIDLLRYVIPAMAPKEMRTCVGIEGDVPFSSVRTSPIYAADRTQFSMSFDSRGPLAPLHINEGTLRTMEQIGVFTVSEILKKKHSTTTEFEEAILRGIHWFADASAQTEKENAFLGLITAIETYLTPRENNPIGTAIAEGVAITLTDQLENRKKLKRKLKSYYSNRSSISHGGGKTILDSDLAELTYISGRLTRWMIDHRSQFSTIAQLLEWVEDQKLS